MASLGINKTQLNQLISSLLEDQCMKCQDNSSSIVADNDEDPLRVTYILLLMGSFAFLALFALYWRVSSKQRVDSKDPYNTYIVGKWKKEEQQLVHHGDRSVTLTIGNQVVMDTHFGGGAGAF